MKAPRIRPQPLAWREYALALGTVGVSTGLAFLMFPHVGLSNLIMVYLLGVVAVATRAGRGPTALASVLSVAVFDFFFVPPYLSFAVSDTEHLITFTVMLTVALVISGLTVRIRAQADRARDRERRIAALYALSRDLATTRDVDGLLDTAVRHIADVFPGQLAVLLPGDDGRVAPRRMHPAEFSMDASELAVAHWVYEHRQPAGLGTATLPGARALYLPLVGSRGAVGVLGMSPADAHALESPEQLHQLETFANQMALAIERARASEDARNAEVRAEAEPLRNSLLSSVSHDLRTPLASITGAASSLLEAGDELAEPTKKELLSSIHQEAERLDRLVNNLLEMTRLEGGGGVIHKEWQPLEGVLGAALKRLEGWLRDREVHIDLPADLPLVPLDALLVEQVLLNILENAAKYTPPGTAIDISATSVEGAVRIDIADRGPGFVAGEEERVFDKFYRGPGAAGRGVGLGLAISRAIVEVHGGKIWAEPRVGGGAVFRFTLPIGDVPPEAPPADG